MKKQRTRIYSSLAIVFLLLAATAAFGQSNFYVSPTGNDGNSGSSLSDAWLTIQHSMYNATPNSVVNITAGTYNEKVEVWVSGTSGNRITFQNYQDDEVILDGTGINSLDAIIGIFGQEHIVIKGLILTNNERLDAQGIIVEGNCQDIQLLENEISNINFSSNPTLPANANRNSQPIIVFGSNASNAITDLVISGNLIYDCRTGFSEGLAVNGNVDGFEVTNNTLHAITNIGIDIIGHEGTASANDQARNGLISENVVYDCKSPYATAAGIYVDGGRDLIIERNLVYNCQWGIEIGCENVGKTTSNVLVRNNIVHSNDDAGLSMGGYNFPSGSGKVIDCVISNNTFFGNDRTTGGLGGVAGELTLTYTENCSLLNNIFYAENPAGLMMYVENGSLGLELDYNVYFPLSGFDYDFDGGYYNSFSAYKLGSGQEANSLNEDPLLVDAAAVDALLPSDDALHLQSSSPARNTGDPSLSVTDQLDYDGQNRLQGGAVDIGADEIAKTDPSGTGGTPLDFVVSSTPIVYPNPVLDNFFLKFEGASDLEIWDMTGKLLYFAAQPTGPIRPNLPAGAYFVTLTLPTQNTRGLGSRTTELIFVR